MRGTTPKPLFAAIQAAREQVPPQAHAALAATVQTRIALARVFGCAVKASYQAAVGTFQSATHVAVPHSELPQCARGFLAEDVACGCRRDALTREQDNALGALGRKSGERTSVGPRQPLACGDPPCGLTACRCRVRPAVKKRGIYGVKSLRKTGFVDQHALFLREGAGVLPCRRASEELREGGGAPRGGCQARHSRLDRNRRSSSSLLGNANSRRRPDALGREVSCGKRSARAGLQVFLEKDGLVLGREFDRHDNGPRPVSSCVPARSRVVPRQPFGHVTRDPDVVAARVRLASEDVDEPLSSALHDSPVSRPRSAANC